MDITVIETWSTRGLRYQVELAHVVGDNHQARYEVREYTRGHQTGCAVMNTLEAARTRLALAIALARLDKINYTKV